MRTVLTGGVFNIIHPGHIHTLNAARSLGDRLVVVVASDKTAIRKRARVHPQHMRMALLKSLRMVDEVVAGNDSDIYATLDSVRPDIVVLGYDQHHSKAGVAGACAKIDPEIKVVRLESPVPRISSGEIERRYGSSLYAL